MRSRGDFVAVRACPACESVEPIREGEAIWPAGWRCVSCGKAVPLVDGVPSYAPALADTATGFDPSAFDWLVEQEAGHYWFEARNFLLLGLAKRYFPTPGHYMEIGCGTGFVLDRFARVRPWASLTGSELHPAGLKHARIRLKNRAFFVQMDARRIPARNAFDLIGAYDVLEHIDDDDAVLRAVHSALAPGGGFIASVPQHPFLWSAADDLAHHMRRYRRGELEAKLSYVGFEIVASTSFAAIVMPLMMASRLRRKRARMEDFMRSEFAVPTALNLLLKSILKAEVAVSLRGFSWPFGGSRVVVARKREPFGG
jgi:SAM-dependent methyltransferase